MGRRIIKSNSKQYAINNAIAEMNELGKTQTRRAQSAPRLLTGNVKIFAFVAIIFFLFIYNQIWWNAYINANKAENEELKVELRQQQVANKAENEELKVELRQQQVALNQSHAEFFPFQISGNQSCAKKETILAISDAIKELNEHLKIRVFPRNGFLLGIIRHGGYLPNEGIDSDLAVISTDIDRLNLTVGKANTVGRYEIIPKPTSYGPRWVNWKNKNPISGKSYPFFFVHISSDQPLFSAEPTAFYPYRKDNYFYPHASIKGYNHEGSVKEMQRYNTEGANIRLVDTDQLVNRTNFEKGKQIGVVYPSTVRFDCMVEKQFYFTTILVPCNYEAILQAYYGINWRRLEKRVKWESVQVSEEENIKFLKNGPLPLCA